MPLKDNHWYVVGKVSSGELRNVIAGMSRMRGAFASVGNDRIAADLDHFCVKIAQNLDTIDRCLADALADELEPTVTEVSPDGRYTWKENAPKVDSSVDVTVFK